MNDLKGKTALVTGASRGIGKAIAQLFASSGASIVVHYNSNKTAAEEVLSTLPGNGHISLCANMQEAGEIEKMVDAISKYYSKLDVLVNNAGIYEETNAIELGKQDFLEYFNKTMATNLTGPAHLSFLAAKIMKDQGGGKIINITSRGAFRGEPTAWPYGAAKAGLNSLGQSMAKALAKYKIMVYTIAPGFVETDMTKEILEGPRGEEIRQQSPLNRAAKPEEIASLATFLAGEGHQYMTGSIIDINGASYLRS